MQNIISAEGISKRFGERILFDEVTFGLNKGDKVGLVGLNGCGKSTFLKIIAGAESPDQGVVAINKEVGVGLLMQEVVVNSGERIADVVLSKDLPAHQAVIAYEAALKDGDDAKMQEALESMDKHEAWGVSAKIGEVLGALGFSNSQASAQELSGGQKRRLGLAKALLLEPDMLILDEPTNHLDIDVIEWLEKFINENIPSALIISHDRWFLDNVVNQIWELSPRGVDRYNAKFVDYLVQREERLGVINANAEKAGKKLQKELEWARRQPKARSTKAKYRLDGIGDLKKEVATRVDEKQMSLLEANVYLGKKVLEFDKVSFSRSGKKILDSFDYAFSRGEKVGVVGGNGVGKTSFVELITEGLKADSGIITKGPTTKIGYFKQSDGINENMRVLDYVLEKASTFEDEKGAELSAIQLLSRFLFPPKRQREWISKLSGGEKKRLQLLRVLMEKPNFLILDEPTNDLDIFTMEVLEDYLLNSFTGCLLVITHDRFFLEHIVDKVFFFKGLGEIQEVHGGYTHLTAYIKEENKRQSNQSIPDRKLKNKEGSQKKDGGIRKPTYKEKKEYEGLMGKIEALEIDKETIEKELESEGDYQKLQELGDNLRKIELEINTLTDRWLELSELFS